MMQTQLLQMTSFAAMALLVACGGPLADSTADESSALELEFGGFDDAAEAPMFGDSSFALLDEALEADSEPRARDTEDPAETRRAEYLDLSVHLLWGNLRPDRAQTVATDWSGVLSFEGAAIARVRPIRFEGRDQVSERSTRGQVAWVSHTTSHHDGLQVLLRVPLSAQQDPRAHMTLRTQAFSVNIPLQDLLHLQRTVDVGDNQIAIHTYVVRPGECQSGGLRGHWAAPNAGGAGRFLGRWVSEDGTLVGHVRGAYGVRRSGEKVFFGKVIDSNGRFLARLAGHYDAGAFGGRWLSRAGDQGAVAGRYHRGADRGEGGTFMGRWTESCGGSSTMPPQRERPEAAERAQTSESRD